MKKVSAVVLICIAIIVVSLPSFAMTLVPMSYDSVYFNEIYQAEDDALSFDEKAVLSKECWALNNLKPDYSFISIDDVYKDTIAAIKNDVKLNSIGARRYINQMFATGSNIWILKIAIDSKGSKQCANDVAGYGYTLTPATILEGFCSLKNGKLQKVGTQGLFKQKQIYLAQSYYVKKTTDDTNVLSLAYGSKQKPLLENHTYIIQITHHAVVKPENNKADGMNNPFDLEMPIYFFNEEYYWDINDLERNDVHLKSLTDTGMYDDYAEIQYPYVKEVIERYTKLSNNEYIDGFVLDPVKPENLSPTDPTPTLPAESKDPTPTLPTESKEPTLTPPTEPGESTLTSPSEPAWILPALIGLCVGVLVCVVPTAVILIVKKRKKAAVKEAPMTSPTDPPTG